MAPSQSPEPTPPTSTPPPEGKPPEQSEVTPAQVEVVEEDVPPWMQCPSGGCGDG
ncbi:MAG: hypothetical protein ACUVSJ_09140 [Anaerolineae bacterium]